MRVAISTDGDRVAPHFGRCEAYTIVEIEHGKATTPERIPNPGHEPGRLPRYLAERGVECVVAGGMGPRARALFDQWRIQTLAGVSCSVRDAIEGLCQGGLAGGASLCDHASTEGGSVQSESADPTPEQLCERRMHDATR